jgi:Zn-dependent peptidase ImmA (M78 family)/transcriptional regulator with XRE-family HTH domain
MSRPTTKEFFVRERLIEARDARGVTQADLGKAIGCGASTISNWERGHQAPEPPSLDHLASALGVSTRYFLRPIPHHGTGAIFFRSLSNSTARVRTRERARIRWLQDISITLQQILDFPKVNFPQFVEPGAYMRLSQGDLERIALEMRKHWQLGEGPISNMVLVAENAGAVVGVDEIGSIKIDGQGNWSECDHRPYILLACDKNTAFRRQMDVAHELTHLVLHRGVDEDELARNFETIEEQAKYLACAFLLPHRSFSAEINSLSLEGFLSLKRKWRVSVGAMIMRAYYLEILSEAAAQRLWKYRATRGWHKAEPYDSPCDTPVDEPRLLRRSIEMLVSAKVRTKSDLLTFDFCLGASDVEMLACLPAHYFVESAAIPPFEPKLKETNDNRSVVSPLRRPH